RDMTVMAEQGLPLDQFESELNAHYSGIDKQQADDIATWHSGYEALLKECKGLDVEVHFEFKSPRHQSGLLAAFEARRGRTGLFISIRPFNKAGFAASTHAYLLATPNSTHAGRHRPQDRRPLPN